jgi:FixJ family two-component response regulator
MKIYASAPNSKKENLKAFTSVLKDLKSKGHKIIDIYEGETLDGTQNVDYFVKKHSLSEKAIREADMILVDVTFPGRRTGYEIARALGERKTVIGIYNESSDAIKVASLLGNKSKNFIFKSYNDKNIISVVDEAIRIAKDQMDTKFILIISPEIDKYLEWASAEKRMHKAQIVRDAIEVMMAKDKNYKEFLKSIS